MSPHRARARTHTHTHTHIYVYTQVHTYTHTCPHTCSHAYTRMRMCTRIYTYAHVDTHMHICTLRRRYAFRRPRTGSVSLGAACSRRESPFAAASVGHPSHFPILHYIYITLVNIKKRFVPNGNINLDLIIHPTLVSFRLRDKHYL